MYIVQEHTTKILRDKIKKIKIYFAECPECPAGSLGKACFAECHSWTLDKVYLYFFLSPTKLFVVCCYTLQTYIYHFGTIIKVFSITIRFSSFISISSENSHFNCKSLETQKNMHAKMISMLFSTSYGRFQEQTGIFEHHAH